jgi:hypothetical protein
MLIGIHDLVKHMLVKNSIVSKHRNNHHINFDIDVFIK